MRVTADTVDLRSATTAPGRTTGLVVGISGASRNAAAASSVDGNVVAVCEQERLIRLRRAGVQPGTFPAEALQMVLQLAGDRSVTEVGQFATAEDALMLPAHVPALRFDHHFAHAATAFYLSPFQSATVLICDHHSSPSTTVWSSRGRELVGVDWPGGSTSLAGLYSECARLFGCEHEHHLEALARLDGDSDEHRFDAVIRYEDGAVWASNKWRAILTDWLAEDARAAHRIRVAGGFQRHLGRVLLALAQDIRTATADRCLCVGGGLFYNTFFTTLLHQSRLFDSVFVAPNPGNAGLAVGLAIVAGDGAARHHRAVSPFLGPEYDLEDIKGALDNCKLSYECLSEDQVIDQTVDTLQKGRLVGWFQGRMEWAHRALGNRSILASPLSPYVLDNLNVFLKHRERHCAYGFSVPERDAEKFFRGPTSSPCMEYEYELLMDGGLQHAVPDNAKALRVQTIPDDAPWFQRFQRLHEAFGHASGVPVLVNTSFNGFLEPIVCSPRDAIRVFFSTGLDVLVLDRFVVRK
jgi:carbamoyltransferase